MADATEPANPTNDAVPAPARPALEGGPLEGEDAGSLVGIMYSERPWAVPGWLKAAFFWVTVLSFSGLAWYSTAKRVEVNQLMVGGAVEPEAWGNRTAPSAAASPAG